MTAIWIVERTQDARFPFRIRIEQGGRTLFAVRARSAWPGAGTQIFCVREIEHDPAEALEPHETVPVAHLDRLGRKLAVTLDRAQRKRCEFLKLERPYRNKPGTYEQIFFRTEQAVRAHRSSSRAELARVHDLDVVIDSAERYAWRFPGASIAKRKLPVGDYALERDGSLVAIAERKTLENLLTDLAELKGFQHHLSDLASYPHAALVLEAQYADLGNPERLGRWSPAHVQRVVAELTALFPSLQVVFAGNRKLANVWTQRWFASVAAHRTASTPNAVREVASRYEGTPNTGGLDARLRIAALHELPDAFPVQALRDRVPDAAPARVARVIEALRREGRLRRVGHGRGARWERVGRAERASG